MTDRPTDHATRSVTIGHVCLRSNVVLRCSLIIQYLYSALKFSEGYRGAGGFRLRLSEQVCFEVLLKVCTSLLCECRATVG